MKPTSPPIFQIPLHILRCFMIHDPTLAKLVKKQSEDMNNGASEETRINNFNNIVKRQKEILKEFKRDDD